MASVGDTIMSKFKSIESKSVPRPWWDSIKDKIVYVILILVSLLGHYPVHGVIIFVVLGFVFSPHFNAIWPAFEVYTVSG